MEYLAWLILKSPWRLSLHLFLYLFLCSFEAKFDVHPHIDTQNQAEHGKTPGDNHLRTKERGLSRNDDLLVSTFADVLRLEVSTTMEKLFVVAEVTISMVPCDGSPRN